VLAIGATACRRTEDGVRPAAAIQYPEPRYPSYLKPPTSIDEVLPHVRPLVRNKTGFQGAGLGVAQSGDTVTFVLGLDADDLIVQAVKQAMEERGVHVHLVHEYEMVGISRDDALDSTGGSAGPTPPSRATWKRLPGSKRIFRSRNR